MKNINNLIRYFPTVQNKRVLDLFKSRKNITLSGNSNNSSKVFVFADIARECHDLNTVLWVVNDPTEQDNVIRLLKMWTDFYVFAYALTPTDINRSREVEQENRFKMVEFIGRMANKRRKIIVTPYTHLMTNLPDIKEIGAGTMRLHNGDKVGVTDLFEKLIDCGYEVSDDTFLKKGTYHRSGEVLTIFPINHEQPVRVDVGFDEVGKITFFDPKTKESTHEVDLLEIVPVKFTSFDHSIADYFDKGTVLIEDELDIIDEFYDAWNATFDEVYGKIYSIAFVSFNEDDESHQHLHYISVIKYRGAYDLANDMREKHRDGWRVLVFTKDATEIKNILGEYNISYHQGFDEELNLDEGIFFVPVDKEDVFPNAFQNPELKFALISDKEISSLKEEKKKIFNQKVYLDFLTSLKLNDYVVHVNHGIGKFLGLEKRTVDDVTREY